MYEFQEILWNNYERWKDTIGVGEKQKVKSGKGIYCKWKILFCHYDRSKDECMNLLHASNC